MADYQLNCSWEDVENSARSPNFFIRMYSGTDPVSGDTVDLSTKSGSEIYEILSENPNTDLVFMDKNGRPCSMTQRPATASGEVKFSTLVGTTLYIYSIPDGGNAVNTATIDISSADGGVFVVNFNMNNGVVTADQSYDDVAAAAASGKVVIGRYVASTYYVYGDPDDNGITFFSVFTTNNSQNVAVFQLVLSEDESVTAFSRVLSSETVRYTQQTLNNTQKAQARANIGATDGASGISDTIKQELLNCLAHVAWIDEHGQDYYDALEAALYTKTVESISAVFNQGSAVIYNTASLDSLKQYLTVTATYDDTSTATVTAYELSGTLTVGTSTITVTYSGKTTTFNVTVASSAVPIGTPSVSDNILTPGSSGMIRSMEAFSPGSSPWIIQIGFTTGSSLSGYQDLIGSVASDGTSQRGFLMEQVYYGQTSRCGVAGYGSSNGTSWNLFSGTIDTTVVANTTYLIQLEFTGSKYKMQYSTDDGATWTPSDYPEISSSTGIKDGYYIGIGLNRNGYYGGTIDLTKIKVWIDGALWWSVI